MTNEICEINCIHEDRVNRAKLNQPTLTLGQ